MYDLLFRASTATQTTIPADLRLPQGKGWNDEPAAQLELGAEGAKCRERDAVAVRPE